MSRLADAHALDSIAKILNTLDVDGHEDPLPSFIDINEEIVAIARLVGNSGRDLHGGRCQYPGCGKRGCGVRKGGDPRRRCEAHLEEAW